MAIGPRLDLRHTQSLVMTPQLRQAIQLLQFNNTEVSQFIEEELLRNPLLEHADPEISGTVAQAGGEPPSIDTGLARTDNVEKVVDPDPSGVHLPLDADFSNVYDPGGSGEASGGGLADDNDWIGQIA
ncbi:MAG TPA: RNA polymerase sigma-54 factor, partial [Acidiphilium sp.]|nr:RNA polymerase sigma-54 factor [Acidiphilium sp.]